MINYSNFPEYYKQYVWSGRKHKLFGYPPDAYPEFQWIASLEKRYAWVVRNCSVNRSASKYLLQEMIEWGGSQNGVLQKFNDGCGEINLFEVIQEIARNLSDPKKAISSALKLPGLGLSYASKLLRFMKPEIYGALDSNIKKALSQELPRIYDGNNNSMVSGYVKFFELLCEIKEKLKIEGIKKPPCRLNDGEIWRASEIEMALFCGARAPELGPPSDPPSFWGQNVPNAGVIPPSCNVRTALQNYLDLGGFNALPNFMQQNLRDLHFPNFPLAQLHQFMQEPGGNAARELLQFYRQEMGEGEDIRRLPRPILDVYLVGWAKRHGNLRRVQMATYLHNSGFGGTTNAAQAAVTVGRTTGQLFGLLDDDGNPTQLFDEYFGD